MAAKPGSRSLMDALMEAQKAFEASKSAQPAKPFNLSEFAQAGNKGAQDLAFGLTDFIGGEAERLKDNWVGLKDIGQGAQKLSKSSLEDVLASMGTQRGGFTRPELNSEREALGQIGSGALDASLLAPGVGMAGKAVGELEGPLRALGRAGGADVQSANMFIGPSAKTANQDALKFAKQLLRSGAPREEILAKTGWSQDAARNWLFEISDKPMTIKEGAGSIGSLVDHPELFAAYPKLADKSAHISQSSGFGNMKSGAWSVNERKDYPRVNLLSEAGNPENLRSTTAHELQHAVDDLEGRDYGFWDGAYTSSNSPNYKNSIGEVRAKNVETRLNGTDLPPWATEDVPRGDQRIINLGSAWEANGYNAKPYRKSLEEFQKSNREAKPSPLEQALAQGLSPEGKPKPLGYDDWSPEWKAAFDKGLDMSPEGLRKRAIEQGYNVDELLYRGVGGEMPDLNRSNVYVTPDPSYASKHATGNYSNDFHQEGYPSVLPLLSKANNPRIAQNGTESLMTEMPEIKLKGGHRGLDWWNDLKKSGFDSVIDTRGSQQVIFDPANIRSVNAAFDPANAGKPTLLGSGFAFEGKPGEKSLVDSLMDLFKGKKEAVEDDLIPHYTIKTEARTGKHSQGRYRISAYGDNADEAVGDITYRETPTKISVSTSGAEKGSKAGRLLYRHLAEKAIKEGKTFVSDGSVSPSAVHTWERLKKQGYDVVKMPNTRKIAEGENVGGLESTRNAQPVYILRPTRSVGLPRMDVPKPQGFTPPTSLDDIFTGAPTQARPDLTPQSPLSGTHPGADLSAGTAKVGYDPAVGFQGMDQKPPDIIAMLAQLGLLGGGASAAGYANQQAHERGNAPAGY